MVTLENALTEAQKNNRICPQPIKWNDLYNLLPDKKRKGNGWEPSLPLILAAWWDTPALFKALRFREHIEWAAAHGSLDKVYDFMLALPEEEWFHFGE